MTTISQLASIPDKTNIEEVQVELVSIQSQKTGQYGTNFNCEVKDGTGKTYCTFASIKNHDIGSYVGKLINFKSAKNQAGQLCSIRVDRKGTYANLYISNSVVATVVGEASASPAPAPYKAAASPTQSQPSIPPNLLAKRLAEEWVAVYNWTKDTFLQVLTPEQLPERVTSVIMGFKNRGILDILPPPKLDWRRAIVKDQELGKWEPERIRKAIIKIAQGSRYSDSIMAAFLEANKEQDFNALACFGQLLTDNGIDEETANSVLLRDFKALEGMPEGELMCIIGDPKFLDACKQVVASKDSPIDEIDV